MYERFFNLKTKPFELLPNPDFLFMSKAHRKVLNYLEYAIAEIDEAGRAPHVVLADYHLDSANGIDAVIALRQRFGEHLPAVLVTADRSAELKGTAAKHHIPILNKPVKPAALRAVIAQERGAREAAE